MIYFLRHGLDDEEYIGGWSELDLIPEGVEQVNETIKKMHDNNINIVKIISSDIKRAKTTASMVKDSYNLNEVIVDKNFNEQNKGLMNGMKKEGMPIEYMKYRGDNVKIDTVFPEGESLEDLYNRVKEYLSEIDKLEDDTLIVTHRGFINMIYYILNDIPLDMDKKRFKVKHATLHEYDKLNKTIRRII